MGLFLRNKPQSIQYPVASTPLMLDLDRLITGQPTDRMEQLKNSDVYTATNIIAGDIAKSTIRTKPNEK
ncbi:hypothetical protein GH837_29985, partial [Bacillus thuringiensis]|nr:hypothetical protein [Bacillus thuringiensis]